MHKDFLSLESGGQPKEKAREEGRKQRPNMFNIFERLWPCNNSYLSVCEDAAYGFTKGMAQRFIIGKSDPDDRSKMICRNDVDKTEIEKVEELSPATVVSHIALAPTKASKIAKRVIWAQTLNIGN